MDSYFSENEIYSLDDIINEFGLERNDPLLYGIYLSRNPNVEHEEKELIKAHIDKLIKKQQKINKINLEYMTRHINEN